MAAHVHVHTQAVARARTRLRSKIDVTRRGESGKYIDTTYTDAGCTLTRAYLCAPVGLSRHAHHWANIRLTKQGRPPPSLYTYPCTVCRGYIAVSHDAGYTTVAQRRDATRPNVPRANVHRARTRSGDNSRASPEITHRPVSSSFFLLLPPFTPVYPALAPSLLVFSFTAEFRHDVHRANDNRSTPGSSTSNERERAFNWKLNNRPMGQEASR